MRQSDDNYFSAVLDTIGGRRFVCNCGERMRHIDCNYDSAVLHRIGGHHCVNDNVQQKKLIDCKDMFLQCVE